MTAVMAALRTFGGPQKVVYWREASWGLSTPAYFLAKNVTHLPFILLAPLVYLNVFLLFVTTRASLSRRKALSCPSTTLRATPPARPRAAPAAAAPTRARVCRCAPRRFRLRSRQPRRSAWRSLSRSAR